MIEWLDLQTAAQRAGTTIGHLRRECLAKYGPAGTAEQRKAGRGKPRWFISEAADAAFARVKFPEQIGTDLNHLTEKKRREAFHRLDILNRWEKAKESRFNLGLSEKQVTGQFIATVQALDGRPLCRSQLYEWHAKYRRGGLAALADQRTGNGLCEASSPADDRLFELVKRLWLTVRKPSLRSCYAIAEHEADQQGWSKPSYQTIHRKISEIPDPVVQKLRNGKEAFTNNSAPFIERDYSGLRTNELWCGDHHQFDVKVVDEDGQLMRPWLTAWQDMRSRKIVGWRIFAHAPNSETILLAFRDAVETFGVPHGAYIDNGKDYDSFALNGRTKTQRWAQAKDQREGRSEGRWIKRRFTINYETPYISGLFGGLGVDVTHCQPYHGQSKPIERWFRTLEEEFGRSWPTYCGNSPDNRPEDHELQLERGKAPALATFVESFTAWLDAWHRTHEHTGDGMGGRTPDAVYAAEWGDHSKRTAKDDLLWFLTLKQSKAIDVTQNGVTYNSLSYGQDDAKLWEHKGRKVYLRVDPDRVNAVLVCDRDGKPICVAQANRRVPVNATAQEQREANAAMARDRRRVREYHTTRPMLAASATDRIIMARHAKAAKLAESAPPPADQPTLQPVRAPFEDQLPALQRAMQHNPMRLAVGAESISFGDVGDALSRAQRDDSEADDATDDPFLHLTSAMDRSDP